MSEVTLSVGIMCAPWVDERLQNSLRIQQRLEDNGIPTHITNAKQPDHISIWDTRTRVMEDAPSDATHLLVIQDDLMPVNAFETVLQRAVTTKPDEMLSLFLSARKEAVNEAQERGKNWVDTPGTWGAAIVLKTEWIPSIIAFEDQYTVPEMTNDDYIINMWNHYVRDARVWTAQPSLVEHVGHDKSIQGNNPPMDRTATWFERDVDPDTIDYTDQTDLPTAPGPYPQTSEMDGYLNCDPAGVELDVVL